MATKKQEHSKQFQKYYDRYQRGGCTNAQLRQLTERGILYDWEYTEITGEPYEV